MTGVLQRRENTHTHTHTRTRTHTHAHTHMHTHTRTHTHTRDAHTEKKGDVTAEREGDHLQLRGKV